ncbi:sugar phosphate isomerase/epimerase [Candidatus Bipolaricaulota bacterium]|nr:sugar phosphate isomerase/epimerase [Candidatus Bipolaricaulota bacterium]
MRLFASTLAFHPLSPDRALERALALGYQGVEVLCDPPWHPRGWPSRLVRRLKGAELSLHAPIADVNLISPHPQARAFAEAELARTLELAARLGARGVTFHLGYRSTGAPYDPPWGEAKAAIHRLSTRAHTLGVTLALENDPKTPYSFLWDLQLYGRLLSELSLPGTLDLGHAWTAHGEATLSLLPRLRPHIHSVHLHDNHGQEDEHLPLGQGTVKLKAAIPLLHPERWVVEATSPQALAHDLHHLLG